MQDLLFEVEFESLEEVELNGWAAQWATRGQRSVARKARMMAICYRAKDRLNQE